MDSARQTPSNPRFVVHQPDLAEDENSERSDPQ